MNKLKTLGLTALAGSLAVTTANAADYVLSGDTAIKYSTIESASGSTLGSGEGFAGDTSLYFDATGELDNGWTVGYHIDVDNATGNMSATSTQIAIGMGSMGTIQLNQIGGAKANGIDDVTPTAYGESWDETGSGDPSFFGGSTNKGSIQYGAPALEAAGATIGLTLGYDPASDENIAGPGSVVTTSSNTGTFAVLTIDHESGLSIGGGIEKVKTNADRNVGGSNDKDEESVTAYAKYTMGPISVGYQEAYQDTLDGGADLSGQMLGIAYTVGDLSISYGESTVTTEAASATAASDVDMDAIGFSYTMGSMTIGGQHGDSSTSAGGASQEETELRIGFSF